MRLVEFIDSIDAYSVVLFYRDRSRTVRIRYVNLEKRVRLAGSAARRKHEFAATTVSVRKDKVG